MLLRTYDVEDDDDDDENKTANDGQTPAICRARRAVAANIIRTKTVRAINYCERKTGRRRSEMCRSAAAVGSEKGSKLGGGPRRNSARRA